MLELIYSIDNLENFIEGFLQKYLDFFPRLLIYFLFFVTYLCLLQKIVTITYQKSLQG